MNPKTVQFQYDINRMDAVNLVATIHIDDYDTRFLEVLLYERGGAFDVSGSTAAARFVTLAGELLNDSVPCTVEGNAVTVPVDASAVKSQACTLKIEINLTKDGKVLTLPFPLFVRVRGSILDDAHITPESKGTIAELLKAAQEALDAAAAALEGAGDYSKLDNKPQINGHTLSGNKTSSELGLQGKLTAGENVTIDENGVISAEGGTDDYNALVNKPRINGYELTGDKTADQLYLQPVLIAPENGAISLYTLPGISAQQITLKGDIAFLKLNITDYAYANGFQLVAFQADAHSLKVRGAIPIDERGVYFKFVTESSAASPYNNYEDTFYFSRESGRLFHRYLEGNYLSSWSEISLGSQIVSGVVNQNGTISFYDADGNLLFTTTGVSVIGFSPVATVTQTASGATVSITDKNGTTTANISNGAPGQDYVLTAQDKTDIANIVLQLLPTTEGVLYGD